MDAERIKYGPDPDIPKDIQLIFVKAVVTEAEKENGLSDGRLSLLWVKFLLDALQTSEDALGEARRVVSLCDNGTLRGFRIGQEVVPDDAVKIMKGLMAEMHEQTTAFLAATPKEGES